MLPTWGKSEKKAGQFINARKQFERAADQVDHDQARGRA